MLEGIATSLSVQSSALAALLDDKAEGADLVLAASIIQDAADRTKRGAFDQELRRRLQTKSLAEQKPNVQAEKRKPFRSFHNLSPAGYLTYNVDTLHEDILGISVDVINPNTYDSEDMLKLTMISGGEKPFLVKAHRTANCTSLTVR